MSVPYSIGRRETSELWREENAWSVGLRKFKCSRQAVRKVWNPMCPLRAPYPGMDAKVSTPGCSRLLACIASFDIAPHVGWHCRGAEIDAVDPGPALETGWLPTTAVGTRTGQQVVVMLHRPKRQAARRCVRARFHAAPTMYSSSPVPPRVPPPRSSSTVASGQAVSHHPRHAGTARLPCQPREGTSVPRRTRRAERTTSKTPTLPE